MTHPRTLDMSLICRLSLMFQAAITALLAHASPTSLTAELIARSGPVGRLAALVFALFVLVALLDLVVNDLMPENYTLAWAARYRWLGVSGIGIVYLFLASSAMVGRVAAGEWVLIGAYVGLAGFCFWWATACVAIEYCAAVAARKGTMTC